MEIVVIIQSSAIALLGYFLYLAYRDVRGLRAQIDWIGNEIYAIKSQVRNASIAAISAKAHVAKKRVASKSPITKPKKDKP